MARNRAVYPILCMIAVTLVVLSACGGLPASLPESIASPLAQAMTEGPATSMPSVLTAAPSALAAITLPAASVPSPTPASSVTAVAFLQAPSWGHRTKTSGCHVRGPLPDPDCSPGDVFPNVTVTQICVRGYTATVRDVPESVKEEVYAEYGITYHASGQDEIDHLIPLEGGGSNDISNLWPEAAEPVPGFHQKDQAEGYMNFLACTGKRRLSELQREIATNWLTLYAEMTGGVAPTAFSTSAHSPAGTPPPPPASGTPQLVSLTSPAARGADATLTVRTSPGASCSITVNLKSGPSHAKGLAPITAGADGMCSWTWQVGPSTTPGTWSINVQTGSVTQTYSFTVQ